MRDYYAPRFEVRISGLTLSADVTRQVTSISYDNNLEMADMFTLSLNLAEPGLLDSALFDLGKTVEIHLGYGRELHRMMLGAWPGVTIRSVVCSDGGGAYWPKDP